MRKKLIIAITILLLIGISFLPTRDPDFGWHYRCGTEFLNSFNTCTKNTFSYFLPNYRSFNPHLLYDLFLALSYNMLGFLGTSILYTTTLLLSALLFLSLTSSDLTYKIISFISIFFLSISTFGLGIRSQVFTYLFFLLSLYLIKKRLLIFSPLLIILWVNTHIGFFLGLVLLTFYFISFPTIKNFLILALSFFATLLNPFGFSVYQEILNHATSPMGKMIAEWVSPSLPYKILLSCIFITILLLTYKKSLSFELLLFSFFFLLAIMAKRNLPFFYTLSFYLVLEHKKDKLPALPLQPTFVIISSLAAFFLFINIPSTLQYSNSSQQYCEKGVVKYPCKAIKSYPLKGNVFSMYEWGGFLIWKRPQIKVFVDGRMPAWKAKDGKSPYQIFLEIIQTRDGWNSRLKNLKTNYLLIRDGTFLDLLLQKKAKDYGWKEVYRDKIAVIYKNEDLSSTQPKTLD